MKIIIYGIGSGRLRIERYLKNIHEIVGYSDSFFLEETFNNKNFYKPQELVKAEFDCVILAIGEGNVCEKISNDLMRYGINNDKILNFYQIYSKKDKVQLPLKRVDRIMQNTDRNFEGIILGLSHSANGIITEYLSKSFCNLAIPSQDLFYNFKQLKEIAGKYRERIKNLKYVIIDMHKYVYFNYDVSLSKSAINYYLYSGYRDDEKHNFKNSINKELKKRLNNEIRSETELLKENLFDELFETNKFDINEDYIETGVMNDVIHEFQNKKDRSKILDEQTIENYKIKPIELSSIQKQIFYSTEEENIEIFSNILKLLKEINKEIKIYIVLIPQFKSVEDREKIIEKEWKTRFNNILDRFRENYKLKILDFKNYEKISSKKEYYFDLEHLNYNGAIVFTQLLDSYIEY